MLGPLNDQGSLAQSHYGAGRANPVLKRPRNGVPSAVRANEPAMASLTKGSVSKP